MRSPDIHPMRSLGLLSVAHAVNHAQAVVLPLIFLKIIDEFGVGVGDRRLPRRDRRRSPSGHGPAQLRRPDPVVSRRRLLGYRRHPVRWRVRAPGARHQLRRPSRSRTSPSRIGGSPQHPVGNGLLAEQFPTERRGFAISAHIAGGNVGTVVVAAHRRAAHRRGRLARRLDRRSASRRSSSRSRSCCSSASAARTARRRWPAARSARRSGGSCATATCAGCT